MTGHIVLLGDSIFDNAAYVPEGASVIDQLQRLLPAGWTATLLAQDRATVYATFRQIELIPADATHVVLSAGGNNALWTTGNIFAQNAEDVREALAIVAEAHAEFDEEYRQLISQLRQLPGQLIVSTIYDAIPGIDVAESTLLRVFNDTITRVASDGGLRLIDLRVICREESDYSTVSPIEPSASGSAKIVHAIVKTVMGHTEPQPALT